VATLLTIHNLGYQGIFWHYDMHLLNIGWEYFTPESLEFFGHINFLKGGIIFSDVLTPLASIQQGDPDAGVRMRPRRHPHEAAG
jgi:starch synthase